MALKVGGLIRPKVDNRTIDYLQAPPVYETESFSWGVEALLSEMGKEVLNEVINPTLIRA